MNLLAQPSNEQATTLHCVTPERRLARDICCVFAFTCNATRRCACTLVMHKQIPTNCSLKAGRVKVGSAFVEPVGLPTTSILGVQRALLRRAAFGNTVRDYDYDTPCLCRLSSEKPQPPNATTCQDSHLSSPTAGCSHAQPAKDWSHWPSPLGRHRLPAWAGTPQAHLCCS